jgi:hypothetical protein
VPSAAIAAPTQFPTPTGCEHWVEAHGYDIAQIHYTADPTKGPAWAAGKRKESPSEAIFRQEYEIDYYAQSGALMFPEFNLALNVCPPFPVPYHWTRCMSIDPHKRRPHAFLWMAVSPDEDFYFYRSYWPSKVYGKRGNVPEDDPLFHIDSYVQTINWLEGPEIDFFGPNSFADNKGQREKIFHRWSASTAKSTWGHRSKPVRSYRSHRFMKLQASGILPAFRADDSACGPWQDRSACS